MGLLKQFDLTNFPDGYAISPGSIATGPRQIYIPAINPTEEKARMLVYDYGGNDLNTDGERKESEEFRLKYTEGIVYGGATWYNNQIWIVSDEQVENEFTGCVEAYSTDGKKVQNFSLPWMWGFSLFQCLGITVEKNSFYILTKRVGWFDDEELKESFSNTYHIERYNINGVFEEKCLLNNINNPVGLTDNENQLFTVGIEENKTYSHNKDNNSLTEGFGLVPGNNPAHGIGYNRASFSVLKNSNPYRVFIYGDGNVIPDDTDSTQPVDPHSASLVTKVNQVFGSLGKYGRNYRIEGHQWDYPVDPGYKLKSVQMYQGSAVDFLTSTNLENKLFKSTDYLKFIPQYTLPGLNLGDIIVDDGYYSSDPNDPNYNSDSDPDYCPPVPDWKFEIIDFKEIANGQFQAIYAQRIS